MPSDPDATASEGAAERHPVGTWIRNVAWPWLKSKGPWIKRRGSYYLLLVFFAQYIIVLSDAALWLPSSMRHSATVFGMVVGTISFHLGLRERSGDDAPRRHWNAPEARQAARRSGSSRPRIFGALLLALASVALFGAFLLVKQRCIVPFEPSLATIEDHGWDHPEAQPFSDHIRLIRSGDTITARLFVPLWYSAGTLAHIEARRVSDDGEPINSLIHRNLDEFVGWLETNDATPVGLTIAVFLALYIAILITGSLAWSMTTSSFEEAAHETGEFLL